jgi:hypothetical protein
MRTSYNGNSTWKLTTKQKERLDHTPGWLWAEPDPFEDGYILWKEQYERFGRLPKQGKKNDPIQHRAAIWQACMRMANKGIGTWKLTSDQKIRLNNTPGWLWSEPNVFLENYASWSAQVQRLGHLPKQIHNSSDPEQTRAASWQTIMRRALKGKGSWKLTPEQKELLDNTPGWLWNGK